MRICCLRDVGLMILLCYWVMTGPHGLGLIVAGILCVLYWTNIDSIPLATVSASKTTAIRYIFNIVYVIDNCKLCAFVMYKIKESIYYYYYYYYYVFIIIIIMSRDLMRLELTRTESSKNSWRRQSRKSLIHLSIYSGYV